MSDAIATIDAYLAMWNETDPDRRAESVERVWAVDGRYLDPQLEAQGHAAIGQMVAAVQARFPGARFRRTSGVDVHHNQCRFGWELVSSDGMLVVAGIDVGMLGPDGRLRSVIGFFGDLPECTAA